jgi:hypothetical protein
VKAGGNGSKRPASTRGKRTTRPPRGKRTIPGPTTRKKTSDPTPGSAKKVEPGSSENNGETPAKTVETPGEKKETPAEKKEAPEEAIESRPVVEDAYVRIEALRASVAGSIPVRYPIPGETEEEPPQWGTTTLEPENGTFLRMSLDVQLKEGEGMALGSVVLTAEGATYVPVQWEAFGRGFRGASEEEVILAEGAALEFDIVAEEEDLVEGGGGMVARSIYFRPGGNARVPVTLLFDVSSQPEGVGILQIAGLSMDIDFSTLGR